MRTPLLVTAGAVSCLLITVAALSGSPRAAATQTVTIDARCAGPRNTQVTVQPWNLRIAQGDDVRWEINAAANTNAITITPKASWPFATNRPGGSKTTPATAAGMNPNSRGKYSYSIQLVCQAGANPPDSVLIDPDVIVD
jgi:plastocyanin